MTIDEETGKRTVTEMRKFTPDSLPDVELDLAEGELPNRKPAPAATGGFEIAKSQPMRVFDRTVRIPSPVPSAIQAPEPSNVLPAPEQDFSKTIPLSEWQSAFGPPPAQPEPEPEPQQLEDGQRTIMKPLRALLPVQHVEMANANEPRPPTDDGATRNVPIDEIMRRRKQAEPAKNAAKDTAEKAAEGSARTGFASTLRNISAGTWAKYAALATLAVLGVFMLLPAPSEPVARPQRSKPPATVAQTLRKPDAPKDQTAIPGVSIIPSIPPETGNSREQREAIDALVAGDLARAVAVYEKLATAHPAVPAYREAARILKEKAERR